MLSPIFGWIKSSKPSNWIKGAIFFKLFGFVEKSHISCIEAEITELSYWIKSVKDSLNSLSTFSKFLMKFSSEIFLVCSLNNLLIFTVIKKIVVLSSVTLYNSILTIK